MRQRQFYKSTLDKLIKHFGSWIRKNISNPHLHQTKYLMVDGVLSDDITILKYEETNTIEYLNTTYGLKLVEKKLNQNKHPLYDTNTIPNFYLTDPEIVTLIQERLAGEFTTLGYSTSVEYAF